MQNEKTEYKGKKMNSTQKRLGRSKTAPFLLINNKGSFLNLIAAKYKYTHNYPIKQLKIYT